MEFWRRSSRRSNSYLLLSYLMHHGTNPFKGRTIFKAFTKKNERHSTNSGGSECIRRCTKISPLSPLANTQCVVWGCQAHYGPNHKHEGCGKKETKRIIRWCQRNEPSNRKEREESAKMSGRNLYGKLADREIWTEWVWRNSHANSSGMERWCRWL